MPHVNNVNILKIRLPHCFCIPQIIILESKTALIKNGTFPMNKQVFSAFSADFHGNRKSLIISRLSL